MQARLFCGSTTASSLSSEALAVVCEICLDVSKRPWHSLSLTRHGWPRLFWRHRRVFSKVGDGSCFASSVSLKSVSSDVYLSHSWKRFSGFPGSASRASLTVVLENGSHVTRRTKSTSTAWLSPHPTLYTPWRSQRGNHGLPHSSPRARSYFIPSSTACIYSSSC